MVDSHRAPIERKSGEELSREIESVSQNPVIGILLKSVRSLLAVLNESRQILAVNDEFLKMLGLDGAGEVLGLRPGEAIGCEHAQETPDGCGTSRFCPSCGAAMAIVAALAGERPEERDCIVTVDRAGKQTDLYFSVKAYPFDLHEQKLVLLFLQDMTAQRRREASERVYFHDIENIIMSLKDAAENFEHENDIDVRKFVHKIKTLSVKLGREVEIRRVVSETGLEDYKHALRAVSVPEVFGELKSLFSNHPAARGKYIDMPDVDPEQVINTDLVLLVRVLSNILTNALEATNWGGEVRLWLEQKEDTISFCVWNKERIRENVARKIFARNFTTKKEAGRGFGTYSARYFAESYLKGKISFTTSKTAGTTFRLDLPKESPF